MAMRADHFNSGDIESSGGVLVGKQLTSPPPSTNNTSALPVSVANAKLFELPREIRDRIYSFCLTSREDLPIEWPSLWRPYGLQPQLLRTCKIIRDEAGPLLYTLNAQMFHHPSDANIFVRAFTSPVFGKQITRLKLHIKAQDMRLWTPYLTSSDTTRSVKADFPALKDLEIRYRSNKWQHQQTVDANMRMWADDSRLDEIMDGLRHIFLGMQKKNDDQWFWEYPARVPVPGEPTTDRERFEREWFDQAMASRSLQPYVRNHDEPILRVTCACRVHSDHFAELTNAAPISEASRDVNVDSESLLAPPSPVKEGEIFRGFTAVDLRHNIRVLYDQEAGSADVAQTPFTDKRGILLSLEIHCLHPKRNAAERAT